MHVRYGLFFAFIAACGGSGSTGYSPPPPPAAPPPPPPPGASTVNVTITDFAFTQSTVTVAAGTIVRWRNDGPSGHTVTSDPPGAFNSGTLSGPVYDPGYGGTTSGDSFSHTFSSQGTFAYRCSLHPTAMTGTVVVTP